MRRRSNEHERFPYRAFYAMREGEALTLEFPG
jgi:hypothetical protein